MPDKYGVAQDKYCYPNSDVLENLLNIEDQQLLIEAEAEFTATRYRTYQTSLTSIDEFSFEHMQYLHHHLFQDLYSWAGKTRDVDISKGHTRFCTWTRIEPEAKRLFRSVPALAQCQNTQELVDKVSDLFCELNLLHPFREGNGRVLRFFFEELLFVLGYQIRWPKISQQQWIDANIDGVNLNLQPLKKIFSQALCKIE